MADNVTSNAGSGGATFRTLADSAGREWTADVPSYVTHLSNDGGATDPNVLQVVQLTTGLPVQPQTGSTWAVTQSGTWTVSLSTGQSVGITGTATVTVAGTATITGTVTTNADTTIGGTVAPSKLLLIGGKSADGTPTYSPIPLAAGSGSVVISGAVTFSGAQPVTQSGGWAVTANAGTNLNTSLLALEAGGNLAGIAANTAALDLAQGSTTLGQTGPLVQGAVATSAPTYTNAKTSPLSLTTAGALRVDGSATTQPVSAASLPLPTGAAQEAGNLATLAGAVSGGKFQTNVTNATLAVTQSGTWTVQQGGTWNVTVNTALPAGTNTIGNVVSVPATSGGCTPYSYISAGSTNQDSQVVKASAGQVYGYSLFNTTASPRYVKIYDKATAPTSADTPKKRIMLPANGGANMPTTGCGIAFANGIAFRITTGPGDSDTGAAFTNDVLVNLDYA